MRNFAACAALAGLSAQLVFAAPPGPSAPAPNPAPAAASPADPTLNTAAPGAHLARSLGLLASATPAHRTPVEVLLYGQSIIASSFVTQAVGQHLRATFPDARIRISNTAIGGYQAERLHLTAWQDLYPAYPDLVIFHVYGGEKTGELEEIFRNLRAYTTADVLTWTHHVDNFSAGISRDRDASSETLRALAAKYGIEIAEVREQWKRRLQDTGTVAADYLTDQIHLNPKGARLLGEFLAPHLPARAPASAAIDARVRTLDLSRPQPGVNFAAGAWETTPQGLVSRGTQPLKIAFTGNRARIVGAPGSARMGWARVLVDGKPVSAHPGTYAASRSSLAPGAWWPAVNRVVLGPDPVAENYTLRFTNVAPDGSHYEFSLVGERTGADGTGESGRDFTSTSGRIRILASDFDLARIPRTLKKNLPPAFDVTWKVYCLGSDRWKQNADPRPEVVRADVLFQELESGPHVLELVPESDAPVAIRGIILHNPAAGLSPAK